MKIVSTRAFSLLACGFLFVASSLLPVSEIAAQKNEIDNGPVGIFASGAEYDQFMGNVKQAAYGEGGNPELKAMVPLLNDIALNRPVGWTSKQYGGQSGSLDLLSNEKVREELEMMDDQYDDLVAMQKRVQERAAEQLRGMDFKDRENLVSQIRKIQEQAEEDLNSVLLPHQLQRLRQLRNQSRLRNRSLVDLLTSDPVKSELEVTDKQAEKLREEEKEIRADLEKQIAELREEAQQRLLSKLKPSQREKAQELIGDAFEFPDEKKRERGKKKGKGKK